MALFRGIQEYIALDANNITLVFDSGNIVNISGNIFLYPPQGHPILYNWPKTVNVIAGKGSRRNSFTARWGSFRKSEILKIAMDAKHKETDRVCQRRL